MPDASLPSDATLARTLRDVVVGLHKAGNTDDLTVKRVRARAEEQLGLSDGFFKTNPQWKQKSHDLIHEAVEKYCGDDPVAEPERPAPPAKTTKVKPAPKKSKPAADSPRGIKRKAAVPTKKPKPEKRRKAVVSSDIESDAPSAKDEPLSDVESEPPKKSVRRGRKVVADDSEGTDEDVQGGAPATPEPAAATETKNDVSESELSSLIDESPVKKKRQKKTSPSEKRVKTSKTKEPKATQPKTKASKAKSGQDDDPDQAEIKRLQSWLVKCGIRKVWSKELAKCDTPRDKIKHLKAMLQDAGMEGKFSVEKAARIKEQRELAKDLEAIQEGERHWGQVDDAGHGGRPRRSAARAATRVMIRDPEDDDDDESDGVGGTKDEKSDDDEDDSVADASEGGSESSPEDDGEDSE